MVDLTACEMAGKRVNESVELLACCEVEKMVVVMDETKAVRLVAQLAVWMVGKMAALRVKPLVDPSVDRWADGWKTVDSMVLRTVGELVGKLVGELVGDSNGWMDGWYDGIGRR
jgi:hypothetical protein